MAYTIPNVNALMKLVSFHEKNLSLESRFALDRA